MNIKNIFGSDIRKIIKESKEEEEEKEFKFILLNENDKILPFKNESFSIIFCLMSLHHVKNLNETLNELFRILKPGSYLLIREHDSNEMNFNLFLDVNPFSSLFIF